MAENKNDLIDLKYGLKNHSDKFNLISDIVDFIKKKFPTNIVDLKLHPQFTKLVCDIIEDRLPNNKKKIDKLEVLLLIMNRVFAEVGINMNDTEVIKQQVSFLIDNKKIKGIRIVKRITKGIGEWIFRKCL